MKTSRKPTARAKAKRAPYRQPKLRSYGSVQSITLATTVHSMKKDGAGGAGKTAV
jgi:hypothetical protein